MTNLIIFIYYIALIIFLVDIPISNITHIILFMQLNFIRNFYSIKHLLIAYCNFLILLIIVVIKIIKILLT